MLAWWTCVWCPNDSSYIWCSRRSCGRLSAETLQTSSQCGRPFLWPPFQRPSGLPKGIHHIWSRHRSSLLISGCPTLSLKATSSPRICRANLGRISSFEPISIYIYIYHIYHGRVSLGRSKLTCGQTWTGSSTGQTSLSTPAMLSLKQSGCKCCQFANISALHHPHIQHPSCWNKRSKSQNICCI